MLGMIVAIVTISIPLLLMKTIGSIAFITEQGIQWGLFIQFTVFAITGIAVLILTIEDMLKHRDGTSLFLFLWLVGTFLFAVVVNWTINGRSLLPLVPAAGILIMRKLDDRYGIAGLGIQWKVLAPLIPAAVLAVFVTYADYRLANTIRDDVAAIWSHPRSDRSTIWFQGHWGFQYYMESRGGKPLDVERSQLIPGDIVIIPLNNTSLYHLPDHYIPLRDSLISNPLPRLSCMNYFAGAGFFSDVWGPMPFVFGNIPPEKYYISVAREGVTFQDKQEN
jgi:hypothetical protein